MTATAKLKIAAAAGILLLLGIGGTIAVIHHGPAASVTPPPTPIQSNANPRPRPPHEVTFADGTTFHILGIRDEPSADNRWWGVDGQDVADPSYQSSELSVNGIAARDLRIVATMNAQSLSDKSLRLEISPSMSEASSDTIQGNRWMMVEVVAVPRTLNAATFRVGLAKGPWTDLVIHDVATSKPAGLAKSPVTVGTITEENGKTIVHTFDSRWSGSDEQETVVVMAGDQIIGSGTMRKTLLSGTVREFNCAKDQVRQVIFRHRPYEWVEMKNVSLRPTTMPTNVQIAPATPEP